MNWIPVEYVDAMAPTTGWAGTDDELLEVLRRFASDRHREVHLIPTSSNIDQLRRVADVVKDFSYHGQPVVHLLVVGRQEPRSDNTHRRDPDQAGKVLRGLLPDSVHGAAALGRGGRGQRHEASRRHCVRLDDRQCHGIGLRPVVVPFGPQLRKVLALADVGFGLADVINLERLDR